MAVRPAASTPRGFGWNHPGLLSLALYGFKKFPRLEAGGLGEWMRGAGYIEAKRHYDADKLRERVGFDIDQLQEMVQESIDKGWMPYHGEVKGIISIADNKFWRNKGVDQYKERVLAEAEFFVNVNTRMDSTALYADYVLPAASHYEAWDLRSVGYIRFVNVFTAPVAPVGESKPDWDIMALLSKKIQERARARGVGAYEDGGVTRNLDTIHDDFTMGGTLNTAYDATKWLVDNSPELDGVSLEDGAKRGFLVMGEAAGVHTTLKAGEPHNPFVHQTVDKKPYPTLSGRITFYCDHDRFIKLGAVVPTARRHAGRDASKYPYHFYSPHTRWGIHSNWRSNKYMLRLQRGEPNIHINPKLAAEKGIADGDKVRIFNGTGEFFAQAKFYPSLQPDAIMIEHAWEPYQFEQRKSLNSVTASLLQPLELVGGWGHLKFQLWKWNANQLAHESSVDIERA